MRPATLRQVVAVGGVVTGAAAFAVEMPVPAPYLMLLITALVTAVCAAALFAEWRSNRAADSLLWWSVSAMLGAFGYALFAFGGDTPDGGPRMLANYAMLGAAGLGLSSVRRMNGASPNLLALVLGPTIWLAASAKLGPDFAMRVVVVSLLHAAYSLATAYELWRRLAQRPFEFRAAAAVMTLIGAIHILRAIFGPNIVGLQAMDPALSGEWVIPMAITGMLHMSVITILVIRGFRKGGQLPDIVQATSASRRARQLP